MCDPSKPNSVPTHPHPTRASRFHDQTGEPELDSTDKTPTQAGTSIIDDSTSEQHHHHNPNGCGIWLLTP
jgi:hypothetical protein